MDENSGSRVRAGALTPERVAASAIQQATRHERALQACLAELGGVDEPTRDLMVHYYTALAAGRGKAEALRGAMLATRAKHPAPVNWAAFVLLGEP